MSLPVNPGYEGFESPEDLYPGNTQDLPLIYTGTYQIRQFGVGGAKGTGRSPTITKALAAPPAHLTTAENDSITHATALYVVTNNDQFNYWAAGSGGITGGTP
jgi:hypothetical protein